MSYNLVHEQWVPVILTDGSPAQLSLREVFPQAHKVRRLAAELPTQSFALLRLLLAVCHAAKPVHDDEDYADLLHDGLAVEDILTYLHRYEDRFDLFHPERPFYQVASLRTAKDESSGLEKLISDVPNGHPFLTTRAGPGLERISAAEAAIWLIHCQAFDPSGIRSGAVGDPEVKGGRGYPIGPAWCGQIGGVVLHGKSLAQTLVFNTVPTPESADDRPVWELEAPLTANRLLEPRNVGPVELLTWQSRRIRLIGDRSGVTGLVLAQGDKMTPQNRQGIEFMTAWRYSKPQSKKFGIDVYMPLKHNPNRFGWRGMPQLVSAMPAVVDGKAATIRPATVSNLASYVSDFGSAASFSLETVGMDYGAQEATTAELVNDELDFRISLLGESAISVQALIEDAVGAADNCVWEFGRLAANIARAGGDFDATAENSRGPFNDASIMAWAALDGPARAWFSALTADSDIISERRRWQDLVRTTLEEEARQLARRASPAAIAGRKTKYGFMTAALAEVYFLAELRRQLPLAYATSENKESSDD